LGIDTSAGRTEAEGQERAAAGMVHQLARLIVDTRPFVLCFDQIESLQLSPDDRTGFFAFGRLAADLVDQIESLFLITCVQSGLWPLVRQAIAAADFHRLAQDERLLKPITADEATALIRARLDGSPALRHDPRRDADPLWPLGADGLRTFLGEGDCTPRRLIAVCREAFPHAYGEPPDIAAMLSDLFERRRLDALTALDDTTATFVHGLAIMVAVRLRVPSRPLLAVEHPCYVVNAERGMRMLGGLPAIARASASNSDCMECFLRPDDPLSHPLFGVLAPTPGFLLKVTRRPGSTTAGEAITAEVNRARACLERTIGWPGR
jgi:hypothetical protein